MKAVDDVMHLGNYFSNYRWKETTIKLLFHCRSDSILTNCNMLKCIYIKTLDVRP